MLNFGCYIAILWPNIAVWWHDALQVQHSNASLCIDIECLARLCWVATQITLLDHIIVSGAENGAEGGGLKIGWSWVVIGRGRKKNDGVGAERRAGRGYRKKCVWAWSSILWLYPQCRFRFLFSVCFTITAVAQTATILSASSAMSVSGTRNFASTCNGTKKTYTSTRNGKN